jgi:nitrite reductase/ring-hydroxylating ferredoxin subunit
VSDQFLDLRREYIQCATHDALFRITDGVCLAGPCAGDRLTAVQLTLKGGEVMLAAVDGLEAGRHDAGRSG